MNTRIYFLLITFLFSLPAISQLYHRCGTMYADSVMRSQHPQMGSLQDMEQEFNQRRQKYHTEHPFKTPSVLTIPVIFHIIHNGEAVGTGSNISTAAINSQLQVLNEDFRKMMGTNGHNTHPDGADTEIEFCMATVDENNDPLPEPGINRIDRNTKGWTSPPFGVSYIDGTIKPASKWDNTKYLNIWVCNLGAGLLGYAQFPGGSSTTDGVVLLHESVGAAPHNTFPPPYNLGRTATHEIGHWLGLYHIWGDSFCGDDFCNDTPVHQTANYGCFTHPKSNSCGTPDEMFENYMDYTDDDCMNIFTYDQKDRMRDNLNTSPDRSPLLTSNVCSGGNCAGYAASVNSTQPSCNSDGSVSASGSGGTPPYTYSWSTGATTSSINNLAPGTYSVTVTDGNNCTKTESVTLVANIPVANASKTDVTCSGNCNGSATATVSGGASPYTYSWSNGSTTATINALCEGNYSVTVTDNKGCTSQKNITIGAGINIALSVTTNQSTCAQPNGSASVTASGGTSPYTYLWSASAGSQTTPTAINVYSGYHTVTITDANNCYKIDTVYVPNVGGTGVTVSSEQSICIGDSVNIFASGGNTYVWNTGNTTNNITVQPFSTTTYTVTVTDLFNCVLIKDITVETNSKPNTSVYSIPSSAVCVGSTVQLIASGGATYQWSVPGAPNTSSIVVNPLANTNYSVTAYNGGCAGNTANVNVSIITPAPIAAATADFTTVYLGNSGQVNFFGTGSVGSTFQWDFNGDGFSEYTGTNFNASHTYTSPGVYNAILTSTLNGCSITDTIVIQVLDEVFISVNQEEEERWWNIYPNPNQGIFNIHTKNLNGNAQIYILNNLGSVIYHSIESLTLSEEVIEIDLSFTAAGLYIAFIQLDEVQKYAKIVVEK